MHVVRAEIRVLFVFKSFKDETPLVFSILGMYGSRLGPIEYVPKLAAADEELPLTLQLHPAGLCSERREGCSVACT